MFFNHWYRCFGLPKKIISDRDGRFISKFWKELFRLTQTRLAMSTSRHPQTDGQTAKANRTLEEIIRLYINYQNNNWDDLLPGLQHAYNSRGAFDYRTSAFYDDVWSDPQKYG
jgi:hypothetical protein